MTTSEEPHCHTCRFWIASRYWNVDQAGKRMLDEKKITQEVKQRRRHGIKSEVHYHAFQEKCNKRCIA